jgi:C-terminal processing protease CtpA/Prc
LRTPLAKAAPFLLSVACATPRGSVGAVLAQSRDGRLTVRESPPGHAASRAGIEPGTEILLIDGRDVQRMSPIEVHQALEGDVGSTIRLTVLYNGRVERIALTRTAHGRAR